MLDEQSACVLRRRITAIPADGSLAGSSPDQLDGLGDLPAFVGLRKARVVDPTIAVAADVPVARGNCRGCRRVRLEGFRAAEDRNGHGELGEDPVQPPETDASAVFEHAL